MNPIRIAMWSGPRNISTAMLRAWENRADTSVCDEPLYAHYLSSTGSMHPGREDVLAAQSSDWREVARMLSAALPTGKSVFYQKHMAHHLLPDIEREWLWDFEHAFLLRDPREMLLSLTKVTPSPGVLDTGLPQQLELFDEVRRRTGKTPAVLDAKDVLQNPEALLRQLCRAVQVAFDASMLSWPAGKRASDGVWAPHWYAAVERSSAFEAWQARPGELSAQLAEVHAQCLPYYQELHAQRLLA